jgi:alkylation response protein AidB-like acyl-CoA dehydrogenase
MHFRNELDAIVAVARRNGRIDDPSVRQRLAEAHSGLEIMRWNTLRVLSAESVTPPPAAMITKLYWASWHRDLGELAMDVLGPEALLGDQSVAPGSGYELTALQRLFLFTRSDTIYAGSNQIQRNIIGERALGLPKEPT